MNSGLQVLPEIRRLTCRELELEIGQRTLIMGIVNVTPDSFSDGGDLETVEDAVQHAQQLVEAGADLIDVGGESTRPGASKVPVEEELRRVIPVITALKEANLNVPISIDTYKSEVAETALEAGAHIINDVWGLLQDEKLAKLAADYACPLIITHNRKQARPYEDLVSEVVAELQEQVSVALAAGVSEEAIVLDPGIGFAKTLEDNLTLMNQLHAIVELGYPVVLGTSRKSMIQRTLNLPANDVIAGTISTLVLGIVQGCQIMRVHDVEEVNKAVRMVDAILRKDVNNG